MFFIRELCNSISSPVRFGETDRGGASSPRTCHSLEQQQHQQVERQQQPQDDDQHLLVLNGDSSRDGAVRSVVDSWAQAGGSQDSSRGKKKEGRR